MTDHDRPNPEVLENEIERSRVRVAADLDQLSERLKPEHLKERAKDAFEDKVRRAVRRLIELIRDNPMPYAVGAGVTGLLMLLGGRRSKGSVRRTKASRRRRHA